MPALATAVCRPLTNKLDARPHAAGAMDNNRTVQSLTHLRKLPDGECPEGLIAALLQSPESRYKSSVV
jgi:hypothetical protein